MTNGLYGRCIHDLNPTECSLCDQNQKLRELIDEKELGIFIHSNGRMVTHEFIDNMKEVQKLLEESKK